MNENPKVDFWEECSRVGLSSQIEDLGQRGWWFYFPETKLFRCTPDTMDLLHHRKKNRSTWEDFLDCYDAEDRDFFLSLLKETNTNHWNRIFTLEEDSLRFRLFGKINALEIQGRRVLFGYLESYEGYLDSPHQLMALRTLVEQTKEGILITDAHGFTTFVNKGMEDLTGYSADELLGKKPGKLLQGPGTDPDTVEFIHNRLQEKKAFSCEILNYTKTGHEYWVKLTVHPHRDKEGFLQGFLAVETNITGERMINKALKNQQDELQKEIRLRKKLEEELRQQARKDPLTGIPNRRYFFQEFARELDRAGRYQHHLSVLMFDIDYFKQVNDRFGHATGDMVLIWMVNKTARQLRSHDFFSRIGGEEFVILLPDTALDDAYKLAERLRKGFDKTRIPTGETTLQVTCSYGIAQWDGEESTRELLERSDQALYRAKDLGRNRVEIYQKSS